MKPVTPLSTSHRASCAAAFLLLILACRPQPPTPGTNAAPSVEILAPSPGADVDSDDVLCARVADEDAIDAMTLLLTSSRDGLLWDSTADATPRGAPCGDGGNVLVPLRLTAGQHALTLRVWDAQGAAGEASLVIEVQGAITGELGCTIATPAAHARIRENTPFTASARVVGADIANAGLVLAWSSSVSGALGAGVITEDGVASIGIGGLTIGDHVLTLTVTHESRTAACGVPLEVRDCVDEDQDGVTTCDGDCDDTDAEVKPGATEVLDGADNDCDGDYDEGTALFDDDDDGFSELQGDCDDANALINPSADEDGGNGSGDPDGIDNNCNGLTDEFTTGFDDDSDGYCEGTSALGCTDGSRPGDCNDSKPTISPGRVEVLCDGTDQNCNGYEDDAPDADGDGHDVCSPGDAGDLDGKPADCLDNAAGSNPSASEVVCDGVDQDCDGIDDDAPDGDHDGYDVCAAASPGDTDGLAVDCADDDPLRAPGLLELPDGVDQDCDAFIDEGTAGADDDGDGFCEGVAGACTDGSTPGDCNDAHILIHPGATELADTLDNDCNLKVDDGTVLYDDDGDGLSEAQQDCNDADADIEPGRAEIADGKDNDCDGKVDEGTAAVDDDGDGYCDAECTDGSTAGDCDDSHPLKHPNRAELADGIDNDCDDLVDEATVLYDDDGDGFSEAQQDCNDADQEMHPGHAELPDGKDNDCDGKVDEGTTAVDDDGDGFCEAACTDGSTAGDCDDTHPLKYPGGGELADGIDNDCDDIIDEATVMHDDDGDGFSEAQQDCNDGDAEIAPGHAELADGKDNDCDGKIDEGTTQVDDDGDGYCELACTDGSMPGDCDDAHPLKHPNRAELADGIDNDCDTTVDENTVLFDDDGDGFSEAEQDCDDGDVLIHPGRAETPDGKDNDCDGATDEGTTGIDDDGDGYCETACLDGSTPGDCNDENALVYPSAAELADRVDNDCDNTTDEGTALFDDDGDGFTEAQLDCDDTDDTVYRTAPELADNKDNDCDGIVDEGTSRYDDDLDGFTEAQGDCNDTRADIYTGANEVLCDNEDQNCNGMADDAPDGDGDGYDVCAPSAAGDRDGRQADCAPADENIHPGATETVCDGIDQDCDGLQDDAVDGDDDGYDICDPSEAGDSDGRLADCRDDDPGIRPAAVEVVDGTDQDCDGFADEGTTAYDDDGDGYCEAACTDGSTAGDCDDAHPLKHPNRPELADGIDNDCDNAVDEGTVLYDDDGDGLSEAQQDCNDADGEVHPGHAEVADGKDNDCDGKIDEGTTAYDDDGDGYCEATCTDGSITGDCDDAHPLKHPNRAELADGIDNDCDNVVDENTVLYDDDGDGFSEAQQDCNDGDALIYPGRVEVPDGKDNDCDGATDEGTTGIDDDDDGYCETACLDGSTPGDCDDLNPLVYPTATELVDRVDNDCDNVVDEGTALYDDDGDGFTEAQLDCNDTDDTIYPAAGELADNKDNDCDGIVDEGTSRYDDDLDGFAENAGDCDDTRPDIYLGASEVLCDNEDQNCNGMADDAPDSDNDGYDVCAPSAPGDSDGLQADCAPGNAAVNPGATEVLCDGIDQDCDGIGDDAVDGDNDGYDTCEPSQAGDSDGRLGDCRDAVAGIHPGATELIDGEDQDCDGFADEGTTAYDDDGDGYCEAACTDGSTAGDCNDANTVVKPGATEIIDGLDNDCDGDTDEGTSVHDDDGDGFTEAQLDCNDANDRVYPGAPEDGGGGTELGDSIDNDCDGFIDEGTLSFDDDRDGYCEAATCTDGSAGRDCNDSDYAVNPGVDEICADSVDNDCDLSVDTPDNDDDGFIDELCGGDDCDDRSALVYPGATETFDTRDNDCDNAYDEGFITEGMLVITEIMKNPNVIPDAQGEYFEVHNPGAAPINLHGFVFSDLGSERFTVNEDFVVQPNAYVTLGTLDDYGANGGYIPDYVYPYSGTIGGMQLGQNDDEIRMSHEGTLIDGVDYLVGSGWPNPNGASMELKAGFLDDTGNDTGGNWCVSTTSMPGGDKGTPGEPNSC